MSYIAKLISLVTHILFINEGDVILLEKALSQPFLCYTLKGDILGNRYSDIEESPCSHSLRWL